MSLVIINPTIYGSEPLANFTFNEIDKEISNNLQASLGGARSIVRTKGAGNDAYNSIDQIISGQARTELGARNVVRIPSGALYQVIRRTATSEIQIRKSLDDGISWASHASLSGADTNAVSIAVDSAEFVHVVWWDDGVGLRYNIFDTSAGSWGTSETVYSDTDTNINPYCAITVDSNDKPHVVVNEPITASFIALNYTNKVSGSWKSLIELDSGDLKTTLKFDISIDDDDIPQVGGQVNNFTLLASLGNQNDATSFTTHEILTGVDPFSPSMVIDKQGNTYISYTDGVGVLQCVKHIKAKAWTAWEPKVQVGAATLEDSSMTIDQAGDLYIFTNTSANVTNYFKSTNGGRTWGSAQTDDLTGITDEHCRTRWSFLNYPFPHRLDYTLNNVDSLYFNSVLVDTNETWRTTDVIVDPVTRNEFGARTIVRTSNGNLYTAFWQIVSAAVEIHKSSDEGLTWAELDSGNRPACDTGSVASAIDSTGIIHIVYWDQGIGFRYVTFDTNDGTWGSVVTVTSDTVFNGTRFNAITIDSNDIPHAIYTQDGASFEDLEYTNRVGGSWNTPVSVATSAVFQCDLTIDDRDFPQVVTRRTAVNVVHYIGNSNNPSVFNSFVISTTSIGELATSIVIDKQGNTYVSYISAGDVKVAKHLKKDSFSIWNEVNVATGTFEDTSMIIDSQNNPIVFSNTSSDVSFAYKSIDGGTTWSAIDTSHDSGGITDLHIRARWSYFNYHFPDQFDYTICDDIANDVLYNKIVQTGVDHLYVVGRNPTDSEVEIWYSPTEGQTWEEVDDPNSPTGTDTDSVSCAIDNIDDINIIWWDQGVGARYEKFIVSTQLHGTAETALADTDTVTKPATAIAIDEDGVPHIVAVTNNASNDQLTYINRIGGTWSGSQTANIATSGVDMTMNELSFPVISVMRNNFLVSLREGNVKDATSFTVFNFATTADLRLPSIAYNSIGDAFTCWTEGGDIKFRKHPQGASWTTGWDSIITVEIGAFEDSSMLVDALDNIVIFTNDTDITKKVNVWVSTNGGSSFGTVSIRDTSGLVDEHIRCRWSAFNYNNPSKFDYTIFDDASDDTYYNSGVFTP